jgi:hypothetical protein
MFGSCSVCCYPGGTHGRGTLHFKDCNTCYFSLRSIFTSVNFLQQD